MCALFLGTRQGWLLFPLLFGFAARVVAGPRFSPLGLVVTRLITPRLSGAARLVPGPPKRFAQAIGVLFSAVAAVCWLTGAHTAAIVVVAVLAAAASLEAFAGCCLGCLIFARLIRWHVVPASVCAECGDVTERLRRLVPAGEAA